MKRIPSRLALALLILLIGSACMTLSRILPAESPSVIQEEQTLPDTVILQPQEPVTELAGAYYVRPDGGTLEQCTGQSNTAYSGSGLNQPCAWNHPFQAFPPGGSPSIRGGDTLIIGSGSYQMGFGAPDPMSHCEADAAFDCTMSPVPSGPDPAHPTQILGAGWDSGCSSPPELWGTGRAWYVLNLTSSSNVEVACLEITDHSECVESHSGGLACRRDTPPYGDWAPIGLYAQDSANVRLTDLNIHGLAWAGVHAGRLHDWTVENVRVAANGGVGWDGDIDGDDSHTGTMTFRHWTVEWNGCGETYPGEQPVGCWAQNAGGYGDGVGTGSTGGDWIIEDSVFLHNTSDGLDLLYHERGGTVSLNRVHAEGNAGNQIKITGNFSVSNSVLVGNCAYFEGQPFTYLVDPCRAVGNTLGAFFTGGEQVTILNSSFTGHGDGLVIAGPREGFACNGSERIITHNNVFLGDQDYFDPSDETFLFYQEDCLDLALEGDFNLAYHVKNIDTAFANPPYPSTNNWLQDPLLQGPFTGDAYGMMPQENSPSIDTGSSSTCTPTDVLGSPRPLDGNGDGAAVCDRGAYEWR